MAAPAERTRSEKTLWLILGLAIATAIAGSLRGIHPVVVVAACAFPLLLIAFQRVLLAWPTLLSVLFVVILFIPIRRYTIGENLPIALEPYRVVIAIVLAAWACALAADPEVRWRASGHAGPIALLWIAIVGSLALNPGRASAVSDFVIKAVTFFGSYFLLVCFISSTIHCGRQLDRMVRLLVFGGGIVACCALYEWRTGFNSFNGLGRIFPFMTYVDQGEPIVRGTGVRALASSQHPIELGASLVMLLPLAIYLFKSSGQMRWLGIGAALTLGALSTGSRTAAVMLIVLFAVFVWLRREHAVRILPYALVLLIVVQGVMPGTLGSFRAILNPSYIISEQSNDKGSGAGRIADLGPSLAEWVRSPFVGQGFGTRITSQAGFVGGAQILDNQWLNLLLETGALGVAGLLWLFCRAVRRLAAVARSDPGPNGWLAAALAASVSAYAIGMATFDSFSFIQVTFLAFIMLGFGAVLTRGSGTPQPSSDAHAISGAPERSSHQ